MPMLGFFFFVRERLLFVWWYDTSMYCVVWFDLEWICVDMNEATDKYDVM